MSRSLSEQTPSGGGLWICITIPCSWTRHGPLHRKPRHASKLLRDSASKLASETKQALWGATRPPSGPSVLVVALEAHETLQLSWKFLPVLTEPHLTAVYIQSECDKENILRLSYLLYPITLLIFLGVLYHVKVCVIYGGPRKQCINQETYTERRLKFEFKNKKNVCLVMSYMPTNPWQKGYLPLAGKQTLKASLVFPSLLLPLAS